MLGDELGLLGGEVLICNSFCLLLGFVWNWFMFWGVLIGGVRWVFVFRGGREDVYVWIGGVVLFWIMIDEDFSCGIVIFVCGKRKNL